MRNQKNYCVGSLLNSRFYCRHATVLGRNVAWRHQKRLCSRLVRGRLEQGFLYMLRFDLDCLWVLVSENKLEQLSEVLNIWGFLKHWRLRWKENNDKQVRENWKLTSREMFWTLVLTKGRLVSTVAKQSLCHAFTFHVFWGVCKKSIQELLNILTGSTYTSSKLHSWCHWKQTQNTKSKQNYIVKVKRPLLLNACKLKRKD